MCVFASLARFMPFHNQMTIVSLENLKNFVKNASIHAIEQSKELKTKTFYLLFVRLTFVFVIFLNPGDHECELAHPLLLQQIDDDDGEIATEITIKFYLVTII